MKKILIILLFCSAVCSAQNRQIQKETNKEIYLNSYDNLKKKSYTELFYKQSEAKPMTTQKIVVNNEVYYTNRYLYCYKLVKGKPKAFEFVEWAEQKNSENKIITVNYIKN